MCDTQYLCVESLASQVKGTFLWAINSITENGMPYAGHMHTDLVCPPGFQLTFNIRIISKALKHTVMCDGMAPIAGMDTHTLSVNGMAAYGSIDCSLVCFQVPDNNGMIFSCNLMLLKLQGQSLVCGVILTDYKGACSIHVYPVDNPGP